MTLIITENINPADQEELLAGLREFNLRFLDPAQFGELGVYSRDAAGEMRGGLIAKRKGSWLCIDYLWVIGTSPCVSDYQPGTAPPLKIVSAAFATSGDW